MSCCLGEPDSSSLFASDSSSLIALDNLCAYLNDDTGFGLA
jgi:hypothetical protein